jgi:hypothetical protein
MGQKYKGEKCIIKATNVFAKHVVREEKWIFFLAKFGRAKQGPKLMEIDQTRQKHIFL